MATGRSYEVWKAVGHFERRRKLKTARIQRRLKSEAK
jgi:hypothetical protein